MIIRLRLLVLTHYQRSTQIHTAYTYHMSRCSIGERDDDSCTSTNSRFGKLGLTVVYL